jgi:type IV secretion system protein TrbL
LRKFVPQNEPRTMINKRHISLFAGVFLLLLMVFSEPASASTILDTATDKFKVAADAFGSRVQQIGIGLLLKLALIQISLSGLMILLGRVELEEIIGTVVKWILSTSFFGAVILFSQNWLPAIINSFAKIGQIGSGLGELTPSAIIDQGIDLQNVMVQAFNTGSGNDGGAVDALRLFVPSMILTGLCFLILLSFTVLAAQMVLIQIQGYFWIAFVPVLMGFGGISFTRDIAVGSLKGGITIGVKTMCIYLIAGVAGTLAPIMGDGMAAVTLSDWSPLFWPVMVALILAYLSFQLPKLAGDLLNGTASLSAGDAASNMAMAAAGVAAAGVGAASVASSAMNAGASGAMEATGIAKALGAGMESAHDMGLSGASAMGHAVGEVASHGLGLGSQAASSMTSNVGSAFSAGVEGTTGGKIASAIQASRGGAMEGLPADFRSSTPPSSAPGVAGGSGSESPQQGDTSATGNAAGSAMGSGQSESAVASVGGAEVAGGGYDPQPQQSGAVAAASSAPGGATAAMGDATGASIGGTEMGGGVNGPSGATDSGGSGRQGPKLHERIRQAGDQVPNDGHVVGLNANITQQV